MPDNMEEKLFKMFGKEFPKDSVLVREGEAGDEMFIIQSGKVKILKKIGPEQEKLLAVLGDGAFFGEMSILLDEPRSATIIVEEDAKILVINSKTFKDMIKANSDIAYRIMKNLADRIKESNAQISNLLIKNKNIKVVNGLVRLAKKQGKDSEDGINLDMSLEDIAKYLGMDFTDIDKILQKLMRASLVDVTASGLLIYDLTKLEKFLDYLSMKEQFEGMD